LIWINFNLHIGQGLFDLNIFEKICFIVFHHYVQILFWMVWMVAFISDIGAQDFHNKAGISK
jgi:hypothetical protein